MEAVGDSTFPTLCVGLEADRSLHAEQQEGLDAPFLPSWLSMESRASIASCTPPAFRFSSMSGTSDACL